MSEEVAVDSSGWMEYLTETDRAILFRPAIADADRLIVSVVCIYEVYKLLRRQRGEAVALAKVQTMQDGVVVDVDTALVLEAARYPLSLADSLIYATARRRGATLWTQDGHFEGLSGVRYFPKPVGG